MQIYMDGEENKSEKHTHTHIFKFTVTLPFYPEAHQELNQSDRCTF